MTVPPFVRYQLPFALWIVLIFSLSAIPRVPTISFPIHPDKVAHVILYFILCFFAWRAFYFQERSSWLSRNALLVALLFTFAYGVLDEVHQVFVPGRSADPFDAIADALGGFFFVGWKRWHQKRRSDGAAEK